MRRLLFFTLLALVLGFSTLANAALQDNKNGLIYDTDLKITWYDATPVFRTWSEAVTWAASLTFGNTVAGTWRLPNTIDQLYGGFNSTTSEMGYLYYTELGNKAPHDVNGNYQPDWSLVNKGPFTNLQPTFYWSSTEYSSANWAAWGFSFFDGDQSANNKNSHYFAMAVHKGNVVPIPGALWLLAPGLLGLIGLKRKYLG